MAVKTSEFTNALQVEEVRSQDRQTTISAHVVRSLSVTMSYAEMDTLVTSFGRSRDELTAGQRQVQDEFVMAVEEVRFPR